MDSLGYITIIQPNDPSIFEVVTFLATLGALGISIYQSILARKSLDAAKQAIDEDKRSRQLSIIPKISWVIQVDIKLEAWIRDLEQMKLKIMKAHSTKNEDLLRDVAHSAPSNPDRVGIDRFVYENMPDNLRIIMMSGAQYFYNGAASVGSLWRGDERGAWWDFVPDIEMAINESLTALSKLKKLTGETIPDVLLYTPARLDDGRFIRD